jgi:hypothetical protein
MEELAGVFALTVFITFAVSALQKLRERDALREALSDWPVVGRHAGLSAAAAIAAEVGVPLIALVGSPRVALIWASALLVGFIVRAVITRNRATRCLCFSVSTSPPAGMRGAARNGALLVAACAGQVDSYHASVSGWIGAALLACLVVVDDAHHYMTHNTAHLGPLRGAA